MVWLALLLKMASSPSYLPAAFPSFLLSPLFLLLPSSLPLPPGQTRGSPGLRLASLHPIRIACRACDVTYVFDLSYAWTDMWTGCGGVSRGSTGVGGEGAVAPAPRLQRAEAIAAALRHKQKSNTGKQCERETEKRSLLAPLTKIFFKNGVRSV